MHLGSGGTARKHVRENSETHMEERRTEDDLTLARPRNQPATVASWANRNMTATRPVQFFDEPPPLKARRVEDRYAQMERARLKVTRAYLDNPSAIGTKWVLVWTGRSRQATSLALAAMVGDVFRPAREDRYRWFLTQRRMEIYGLLIPRLESEWTAEMHETVKAFRSLNTRNRKVEVQLEQEKEVTFIDTDPDEIIRGLNHQQQYRYDKKNKENDNADHTHPSER